VREIAVQGPVTDLQPAVVQEAGAGRVEGLFEASARGIR
jgi:hypothetical protein